MRAGDVVSLRVTTPQGPTEVVGTLVAASSEFLSVRRRDGTVVRVAVDTVRAGRVVPPGPAQSIGAAELQAVMADGWRPIETERVGPWLLRAAGGFTGRANSALVRPGPVPDLAAQLEAVQAWYDERRLPPRLQVVDGAEPPGLIDLLEHVGWSRSPATRVMTAEAAHVLARSTTEVDVQLAPRPDDSWLARYREDEGPLPPVAIDVLTGHPAAVFASVRDHGSCVAIARVAVDGRWAGLFAVEVDPGHRRRGLGTAVTQASLRWAVGHGARRVYLQVRSANDGAIAMWTQLGFAHHHDYAYRTAP